MDTHIEKVYSKLSEKHNIGKNT